MIQMIQKMLKKSGCVSKAISNIICDIQHNIDNIFQLKGNHHVIINSNIYNEVAGDVSFIQQNRINSGS